MGQIWVAFEAILRQYPTEFPTDNRRAMEEHTWSKRDAPLADLAAMRSMKNSKHRCRPK